MPICPKCNDEFQDWVKICPDCKTKLVDKISPLNTKKKPVNKKKNTQHSKSKADSLENLPKFLEDFYNSPGKRGF